MIDSISNIQELFSKLENENNLFNYISDNVNIIKELFSNYCSNPESLYFEEDVRPWGNYKVIYENEKSRIKIKIISVKAKCRLSYQSHNYRKEYWIKNIGESQAIIDDKTIYFNNDLIYIDLQQKHRLVNNLNQEISIFEIQEGILKDENYYLKEDDIIRYDDDYKRI